MNISQLKLNPKNPRVIKDEKFRQLCKSIQEFPEMMEKRPMVCVTDPVDGKLFPLGGNMRLKALQHLKFADVPDSWVSLADDWTEEKRAEFTIKDNVSFGEFNWEELANDWDADLLSDWGLDLPEDKEEKIKNEYTNKIKSPVYIPTLEKKPELSDIVNREKYDELILKINDSGISEIEKDFLRLAATRFLKFNYENIAEYYSHSEKEVQSIFEDLALVIIDFGNAIENGFVKISETIQKQYTEDYEE